MRRVIEKTADGSATLFVPELDEHYHSVKGARTESQHIFIDMGLSATPNEAVSVLEIGFGTGLNALLTLEAADDLKKKVHYTGIELYPLDWQEVAVLEYSDSPRFEQLHSAPWEEKTIITDRFTLVKVKEDANRFVSTNVKLIADEPERGFDLVYFDAFAPEKQPEMWSQQLFDQLYNIMKQGGILTTYCAKGVVRRMLQSAGFIVERLPGPPGGKREILRAIKH